MNKFLVYIVACFCTIVLNAQENVGIGTFTPHPSAVLDLESTDKGLLIPRMSTEAKQAIQSPAEGLLVFDTDLSELQVFRNGIWSNLYPTQTNVSNILFSSFESASLNGTQEAVLGSFVIPANTISSDGNGIEIHAFGFLIGDSASIQVKFNNQILTFPVQAPGEWNVYVRLYRRNNNDCKIAGYISDNSHTINRLGMGALNFEQAIPFQFTAQQTTSVIGGLSLEGFQLRIIQ